MAAKYRQPDGGAIDGQEDFNYQVYGNRIEKSYDAHGAGGGGATVTRFAYDAWKNTNQHLVGNENWDVWADLNGSSSLTSRYLRGDVIDQVFARSDMGAKYWTLTDRLGSVRDVVNSSGTVKDTIAYNGFGGITSESDSNFRGRYAWTGREVETEIDLQYNRARWYDAGTGRWISQDPLGFDAGDSNLFRYVRNQAQTKLDPSGYDPSFGGGEKKGGGKDNLGDAGGGGLVDDVEPGTIEAAKIADVLKMDQAKKFIQSSETFKWKKQVVKDKYKEILQVEMAKSADCGGIYSIRVLTGVVFKSKIPIGNNIFLQKMQKQRTYEDSNEKVLPRGFERSYEVEALPWEKEGNVFKVTDPRGVVEHIKVKATEYQVRWSHNLESVVGTYPGLGQINEAKLLSERQDNTDYQNVKYAKGTDGILSGLEVILTRTGKWKVHTSANAGGIDDSGEYKE